MAAMTPGRRREVMSWRLIHNAMSSPRTRGPIRRGVSVLKSCGSSSYIYFGRRWLWVPAFAGTTAKTSDSHSQRLPFAQRLGVARRHVGILRVFADGGEDLPGARAFGADGFFDHDRHAGHIAQSERIGRRILAGHHRVRGDEDFSQVDIEQRLENLLVRDVEQRRGL